MNFTSSNAPQYKKRQWKVCKAKQQSKSTIWYVQYMKDTWIQIWAMLWTRIDLFKKKYATNNSFPRKLIISKPVLSQAKRNLSISCFDIIAVLWEAALTILQTKKYLFPANSRREFWHGYLLKQFWKHWSTTEIKSMKFNSEIHILTCYPSALSDAISNSSASSN